MSKESELFANARVEFPEIGIELHKELQLSYALIKLTVPSKVQIYISPSDLDILKLDITTLLFPMHFIF